MQTLVTFIYLGANWGYLGANPGHVYISITVYFLLFTPALPPWCVVNNPPTAQYRGTGETRPARLVNHTPGARSTNMDRTEPSCIENDRLTREDTSCSAMSTTVSTPIISSDSFSLDQRDNLHRPRQQAAKRVSWSTYITVHLIPARPHTPEDAGISADALASALTTVLASQGAAVEGKDERPTRRGAGKTVSWAAYAKICLIPARSSSTASPHHADARAARTEDVCVEREITRAPETELTAEQEAELLAFVLRQTRRVHE